MFDARREHWRYVERECHTAVTGCVSNAITRDRGVVAAATSTTD